MFRQSGTLIQLASMKNATTLRNLRNITIPFASDCAWILPAEPPGLKCGSGRDVIFCARSVPIGALKKAESGCFGAGRTNPLEGIMRKVRVQLRITSSDE
jgi:hypothetical protein